MGNDDSLGPLTWLVLLAGVLIGIHIFRTQEEITVLYIAFMIFYPFLCPDRGIPGPYGI